MCAAVHLPTHAAWLKSRIQAGLLEELSKSAITGMMDRCRNGVGLSCFGSTRNNGTLWQRYGGRGAGVCVEYEVPADMLGTQLHPVHYPDEKRIHIDQLINAFLVPGSGRTVYEAALLSKPKRWADEEEIRYVSNAQSIAVELDRSIVSCVILGDALKDGTRERIAKCAARFVIANR